MHLLSVSVHRGYRPQVFHVVSATCPSSFLLRSFFCFICVCSCSFRPLAPPPPLGFLLVLFALHLLVVGVGVGVGVGAGVVEARRLEASDGDPAALEIISSRVFARVRGTVASPWRY